MYRGVCTSSERICIDNRTGICGPFAERLYDHLLSIIHRRSEAYLARIRMISDGTLLSAEWDGESLRGDADSFAVLLRSLRDTTVYIDLSGDMSALLEEGEKLFSSLSNGSLREYVRYTVLTEDENTASLVYSGLYHGTFLHGAVPFTTTNEDILVHTAWNGSSHRAVFRIKPARLDEAAALSDLLEQHFDIEIRLEYGSLTIEQVDIGGISAVSEYVGVLEGLIAISSEASITGFLCAEGEDEFALLRLMPISGHIQVQTSVIDA